MISFLFTISTAFGYNPTWKELYASEGWNYSHSASTAEGEVKVYKKLVDSFPCFQGETTTDLEPKIIIEIAADAESAVHWSSADVIAAKELARTKAYVDYYQYLDVPFPLSDRFWFARGHFEQDGNAHLFRWERLEHGGAHVNFYKDIKKKHSSAEETSLNIGAWVVTPRKDDAGKSKLQYLICTHPGGSVPDVLQSVGTEKTLPNNLSDMIREGKRRSQ